MPATGWGIGVGGAPHQGFWQPEGLGVSPHAQLEDPSAGAVIRIPGCRPGAPQLMEEQEGPHVRSPSCRAGLQQANQECHASSRTAAHLCWSQGCPQLSPSPPRETRRVKGVMSGSTAALSPEPSPQARRHLQAFRCQLRSQKKRQVVVPILQRR